MNTAVAASISSLAMRRRRHSAMVLVALGAALVLAALLSVSWGAVTIAPTQLVAIVADVFGLQLPSEFGRREQSVLLSIRLPRVCLGILTGAALAVAGAALQGLFRNPLADPALIGVSTGAALAAVGVIVLGASLTDSIVSGLGPFLLPLAAFAGGLVTALAVYRIASRDGRTDVATMLLAGVAINAIASAGIGFLVFISTDQQLRDLNFWLLGSLGGNSWGGMVPALPFIALAVIVLPMLARHLNAFLLGESEALHLGFNVERTKAVIIVLAALGTGASVAMTGVIGFVGLVVPHLVRLTIGPDHRMLLPASALLGGALMLIADLGARYAVLPAELPIGILTACFGGPFFLWLLVRRRSQRGW